MAQKKPKTLEEQKKIAWEKFLAKQISESDYHMWITVYTEQSKFPWIPKNYHEGGTMKSKKKVMFPEPNEYRMSDRKMYDPSKPII